MFILVQLPLADLRPLVRGQAGRLSSPDWTADDPGRSFIRGFGKVATRNSKAYGLLGERFFADFNNAVRLRRPLEYRERGWPRQLSAELRFRRLYYDGRMAGRFEFGFLIHDDQELGLSRYLEQFAIDPRSLAAAALALPLGVSAPACEELPTTLSTCSTLLGQAYLAATTRADALNVNPPSEVYGRLMLIGAPQVHVRIGHGIGVSVGRDRGDVEGAQGKLFITSAAHAAVRNNVTVCISEGASQSEAPGERAVRVLFSHLSTLLFAQAHFLSQQKKLEIYRHEPLKRAVDDMVRRLEKFSPNAPQDDQDPMFAKAMQLWGASQSGRTEALTHDLDQIAAEAAKPTILESGRGWADSVFKLLVTTVGQTFAEKALKAGG